MIVKNWSAKWKLIVLLLCSTCLIGEKSWFNNLIGLLGRLLGNPEISGEPDQTNDDWRELADGAEGTCSSSGSSSGTVVEIVVVIVEVAVSK